MEHARWSSLLLKIGFFPLVLGLTIVVFGCTRQATKEEKTAAGPSLVLKSPRDGETITGSNVTVRVKVKSLKLEPPGLVKQEGVGHIHYYLDDKVQISAEQTLTFTGVTSGEHTIRVVLVQKDHTPLSPSVEKKIKINVTAPGSPAPETPPAPPGN